MTSPPEVDEPSLLDVFAKFEFSLNDLTKEVKKANQYEQRRLAALPNYIPISRMSSPGVAVTDIQDFDGPQPGRQWIVRLLAAVASPDAANAAKVTWYVGQRMPGPGAGMLPATMFRWQFPSVPGFQNFTSEVIKVLPNEKLIAGLTGIPASSNIALIAAVLDAPLYAQSVVAAVE
jgi:hypothetical protein